MSMVTVHGPNTMYTDRPGVAQDPTGTVKATTNPTNGLKFTFALTADSPRGDKDFNWTFPTDGTPSPQAVEVPSEVTYATGGSKTATCVVSNTARTITNKALTSNVATLTSNAHQFQVGQTVVVAGVDATFNGTYVITAVTANTFSYAKTNADVTSAAATGTATPSGLTPAAGTYQVAVTAAAGQPKMVEAGAQTTAVPTNGGNGEYEEYDPAEHTVAEVVAEAEGANDPEYTQALIEAEQAGKNRSTLITHLESLL